MFNCASSNFLFIIHFMTVFRALMCLLSWHFITSVIIVVVTASHRIFVHYIDLLYLPCLPQLLCLCLWLVSFLLLLLLHKRLSFRHLLILILIFITLKQKPIFSFITSPWHLGKRRFDKSIHSFGFAERDKWPTHL